MAKQSSSNQKMQSANPVTQVAAIRTNRQMRDLSFAFRNLMWSGRLPSSQVLAEVANMAPDFRDPLLAGAERIKSRGESFAEAVAPIFPPTELAAIRAGEHAGGIPKVFDQIWRASKIQGDINKAMKGLQTPVAVIVLSLLVSVGFYLFLIPTLVSTLQSSPGASAGSLIQNAVNSQKWIVEHWMIISGILTLVFFGIAAYFSRPQARDSFVDGLLALAIKFKPFGYAYSNLKFGLVAKYLQIVSEAGVNIDVRMRLVNEMLPPPLRAAMLQFRTEMEANGITAAASIERRAATDPRLDPVLWPVYFRLALSQGSETGDIAEPMAEYGDVMIEDGKERTQLLVSTLTNLSLVIAGVLILIPVTLMYSSMGEMLMARFRAM